VVKIKTKYSQAFYQKFILYFIHFSSTLSKTWLSADALKCEQKFSRLYENSILFNELVMIAIIHEGDFVTRADGE
jgi:hypothetical protein